MARISEKDIKMLWGRAASRCTLPECRRELVQDKALESESYPLGEQAHIVAESPDGPRGNSTLSTDERNSYLNLILLCPTHHTIIDQDVGMYPVSALHRIKLEHEQWVRQQLQIDSKSEIANLIYADLIDSAVEHCRLVDWKRWTSEVLQQHPYWSFEDLSNVKLFEIRVRAANWPGTILDLERSLQTLAITLADAACIYERCVFSGAWSTLYHGCVPAFNPCLPEHDVCVPAFNPCLPEYEDFKWLVVESTKATNWLAEIVRREFNPEFFAREGKFVVDYDCCHLSGNVIGGVYEFSSNEKASLPDTMLQSNGNVPAS